MKKRTLAVNEVIGTLMVLIAIVNFFKGWSALKDLSVITEVGLNFLVTAIRTISLFYMAKLVLSISKNFLYGERDAREKFSEKGLTYIFLKYFYLGVYSIFDGDISVILTVLPSIFLHILFYYIAKFTMYYIKIFDEYFSGRSGNLTKSKNVSVFNDAGAIIKKLSEIAMVPVGTKVPDKSNTENRNFKRKSSEIPKISEIIVEKLEINQKIKTHSSASDGGFRNYFDNGLLAVEGHYKNGELQDRYVRYFRNGRIQEEGYYKDGNKIGKWRTFEESGKLLNEENF